MAQKALSFRDDGAESVELGDGDRFVGQRGSFQWINFQGPHIYLPMNTTLIKDCKV